MKSIVKSQLTGKWYQLARTSNFYEKRFVEIMYYISISCENFIDLLYVGVEEDRTKVLKKLFLKILTKNDCNYIIVKKGLLRKTLKILTFDAKNGILILSDKKMKYISILSRKPYINHSILENYLNNIDFLNNEIKLYSYRGIRGIRGRDGESDERYFEK